MQIVHCSPYRDAEGRPRTDARTRRDASDRLGADWQDQLASEDTVIGLFGDHLDDDYVLVCNVALLEDSPDADMLLVGPNGVWAFEFVHSSGSYQAEADKWLVLSSVTSEYEPVEPSPIAVARDNSAAVFDFLHSKDLPVPWVNPIVILTKPDANFYSDGAVANIVKLDEITQFVIQDVRDLEAVMDETDVEAVVSVLRPFFTTPSAEPAQAAGGGRTVMGMTTAQWLIILGLALANLLLIGGFFGWFFFLR